MEKEKPKQNNSNSIAIFLTGVVISLSILITSFSSFDLPFDGILRDNNGTSLVGVYNDLPTMTHQEKALFEGRSFIYSTHINTTVGNPVYFMGCTQNDIIHFEDFNLDLEGTPFDIHFYENPTTTSNGTLLNSLNMDRNSPNNSSLILYGGPTISNLGLQLFHTTTYGKNNVAGKSIIPTEIILKLNTCYIFEVINNDGATAQVTANFIWHEFNN